MKWDEGDEVVLVRQLHQVTLAAKPIHLTMLRLSMDQAPLT